MKPIENTPDLGPTLRMLIVFAICFGVAFVGSMGTFKALQSWYPDIIKPSWNPPNWIFGPVWTILYALMATSAWRVLESDSPNKGVALTLFGVQLALNGLWSWLFFAWGKFDLATYEIAALWFFVLATTLVFWRISAIAGALLLPYLAWITFAGALNFTIWRLNPEGPSGSTRVTIEPGPDFSQ